MISAFGVDHGDDVSKGLPSALRSATKAKGLPKDLDAANYMRARIGANAAGRSRAAGQSVGEKGQVSMKSVKSYRRNFQRGRLNTGEPVNPGQLGRASGSADRGKFFRDRRIAVAQSRKSTNVLP